MCRLAAYLGAPITLNQFFCAPDHSLYRQSWEPRELRYAKLNADGYGAAWWAHGQPAAYVSERAVWNDPNLPHLGRTLRSQLWLGNVRSATAGQPAHAVNSQPYVDEQPAPGLAFTHNGYMDGFRAHLRREIDASLDDAIAESVRGSTDSEWLFALIRQHAQTLALPDAARAAFDDLAGWRRAGESALLSVVVSDGEQLIVARHAANEPCPSLYATSTHPDFDGWLVASEAFDDHDGWAAIDPHALLVLRKGQPAAATSLPA